MDNINFSNGFEGWYKTHFEIVSDIIFKLEINQDDPKMFKNLKLVQETMGLGDMYELARDWTNEFELKYENYLFDGDYLDKIDEFLKEKYNENNS